MDQKQIQDEYTPTDYIPSSRYDIEQMYEELLGFVRSVDNPYIKQLLEAFFVEDEAFIKKFKNTLRGALDNGGRCIVLLPCGLDNIQPKSNRSLADRIVQNGGCLISEYNVGTPLNKYQYVKRDRLQSGICQGVLVVEAEMNSGTMHTVKYAEEQFKRIACYSHRLVKFSSGNEYLEQNKNVNILSDRQQLEEFIQNINSELTYTQLTLF